MELIEFDPYTQMNLVIGFQGDHNATQVKFKVEDTDNLWLKLMVDESNYWNIPLLDGQFVVTISYTDKVGARKAQIMKNVNGNPVAHTPIFNVIVRPSVPYTDYAQETVPPQFQTAYDQMVAVTEEIQQKLKDGDFIGPSGYSPTVEIKATETGNEVIITDAKGAHTFTVKDGISPTVKTEDTETGVKITVTDAQGDHVFNIEDGFSPTVSVTEIEGGHKITLTDKAGAKEVNVMNGKDGKDGIQGNPGQNATIAIGTVTTLEPDQEATVQNTGTETNAVLSFGIPKGETGATGPQGPQGEPGINENVLHADISKSENPSVDDAYEAPLQDLKMYGKSTQESTTGAQLITYPYYSGDNIVINGVNCTVNDDGSIYFNGTTTGGFNYYLVYGNNYILKAGTYTFSCVGNIPSYFGLYIYDKVNYEVIAALTTQTKSRTFTIDEDKTVYIYLNCGTTGSYISTTLYIMLNEGSTALPYEPYTGRQPSPNPDYPQEITKIEEVDCLVTGANLFDKETITDNSYVSDTSGKLMSDSTQTKVASDYINVGGLSNIYIADTGRSHWGAFYDSDKAFIDGVNGYGSINVPENAKYLRFTVPKTNVDTFMINAGTSALPYEPYQSQHVQFTPPAPLYSLLDGSVADYVDVARGKYVYQLADVTFDGSEDEGWGEYNSEDLGYEGVLIRRLDMKVANRQSGFCDKLTIAKDTTTTTSAWLGVNNNYIYFPYADTFAGTANATEFRTWLATNNLQFIYPLATATEQDIPAETLEALQALKTFNGVTNIFCNAPVSAQYEQSVQIVMNKILEQLNSLQTQTLSLQEGVLENV